MIDMIQRYFPALTEEQTSQLGMLQGLYADWNAKINVISRKDIDNLYEHHILHSLAIAKFVRFKEGTSILDFGTGGGFPGIPLAIMFPQCKFTLIDGTGKKVRVAAEIAKATGLRNVIARHIRGEEEKDFYDFVVSRAVMPLPDLARITRKNLSKRQLNAVSNGLICLKGGNMEEETRPFKHIVQVSPISEWFEEDWFKEKNVVYLPM